MVLFGISGQSGGFDPLILLLVALLMEAYAGQWEALRRLPVHPIKIVTSYANWCDRKLNRESRSQGDRALRGALATLAVILAAVGVGWGVAWLSQKMPLLWLVEMVLIVMLIDQRGTFSRVRKTGKSIRDEGVEAARTCLAPLTHEAVEKMDSHNIARTAIEVCAEALASGVVAPVLWYVLFGFPGLLVFKVIAVMDGCIGRRTPKYRAFGFTAARLNDILMFVPALLSGVLVVLASLIAPTVSPIKSAKIMFRDAAKHRSFNIGWPMGAMAGALGLTLAGPRMFVRETMAESWIGDGSAKATPRDIGRGLYIFVVACLINGAWVAGLTVWRLL